MCRLLVFKGTEPIQISQLVTKPAHSIINQAFDARLRLDATRSVNGDGFGVGWYDADLGVAASGSTAAGAASSEQQAPTPTTEELRSSGPTSESHISRSDPNTTITPHNHPHAPCIFTSVTPAWNNANLHRLAEKIRSPLIFAHVRASTAGALSETNCHPWRFGRLMWMHNGQISEFGKMKRKVMTEALVEEELFLFPQGHTDSEYAFCVFLHHLLGIRKEQQEQEKGTAPGSSSGVELLLQKEAFAWRDLRDAMLRTIASFNRWSKEVQASEPSLMNFVVSDGETVVCSRYVNSRTDEAASLYFSSGTSFYEDGGPGQYRMVKADKRERIILVASEPLTFEKADWIQIPTNTLVTITPKMNLLQQPIQDEFASPTTHEAGQRTPHFAIRSGYQPNVPVGFAATSRERERERGRERSEGRASSSSASTRDPSYSGTEADDEPLSPPYTSSSNASSNASAAVAAPMPLTPVQINASTSASGRRSAGSEDAGAGAASGKSATPAGGIPARGVSPAGARVSAVAADALVSRLKARKVTPPAGRPNASTDSPSGLPSGATASTLNAPPRAPPAPVSADTHSHTAAEPANDAERKPLPLLKPSGHLSIQREHTGFVRPTKRIVSQAALKRFERSACFDEILSFITILNDAVVLKKLRDTDIAESEPIQAIRRIIADVDQLVEETPADKSTGSRFGNAAFRTFYQKVKAQIPALHSRLPNLPAGAEVELGTYLEESWGNEKRIDYGSGMELNFACWLLCLAKLGVVDAQRDAQALVLRVFWDYISVMRKIQSTYWLEPAGSHGVWGLDDYHFLPFLWGAGQLKG